MGRGTLRGVRGSAAADYVRICGPNPDPGVPRQVTSLELRSLGNDLLLPMACIHRWGWKITLNPDATTTATSPRRDKILHSHTPAAAA